ncbi:MAG TPA: alkaline phosphatase D family protein [Gammaproteobacteria bacterium]|nr:alkaline phosphatase D family protein [Gammaproteobacteria bacterium]
MTFRSTNVPRRAFVGAGLSLAASSALRPFAARAAEIRFTTNPFTLGVASGYPEPNAIVLWTRLAPEPIVPGGGMPSAPVAVDWEVAQDEHFARIVRRGTTYATPDWAHSVHVEATGLEPAREYWYRFTSGGERSAVGRTRTAPALGAPLQRLRLAVANCQYYEHGYYAAYRALAASELDLVVHVGDYIYEQRGISRVRAHDAPEAFTLDDYRHRYALYKLDADLQAAHAAFPWMVCSDDHEVSNDYAADHAIDGEPAEVFLPRRAAAYQAYYEHLPLPRKMLPRGPWQFAYTQRGFGDLVNLFMLDGRQYRTRQACGSSALIKPCDELDDPQRTMLGPAQESWLTGALDASRARWNVLGQQTLMAHFNQSDERDVRYWADGWNGYPAARARLVDFLAERRIANPVVLSGDIHAFLVNDLNRRADDPSSTVVATELVATSISSPARPQQDFDRWRTQNPNVRLARSDYRGYLAIDVTPTRLHADLVAVDDVARRDSGTHVLAAFDVASGKPGVAR